MTRILSFLSLFILLLTSCEGPQGPPGFDGIDGVDIEGRAFERTINFQYFQDTGLHEALLTIPFNILESDAILVYRLEKVVDINGQLVDAWSPLPQNFFLDGNDIIQYVFNHTFVDVELVIDGNFDLSTLGVDFTQNQTFKIVVLPVIATNSVDISNLDTVLKTYNITEF